MANPPEPQDDGDRRVLSDVEERGLHVIKVPELGRTPGWAFTIGLFHTYGHPEIVIFGLPLDGMHAILDGLAVDVAAGAEFLAGSSSADVLEGYTCAFREVAPVWYRPLLGYATWFYRGVDFPAVQCLWPDREGHLPEHADFEPELRGSQPLLSLSAAGPAGMEAILHSLDS